MLLSQSFKGSFVNKTAAKINYVESFFVAYPSKFYALIQTYEFTNQIEMQGYFCQCRETYLVILPFSIPILHLIDLSDLIKQAAMVGEHSHILVVFSYCFFEQVDLALGLLDIQASRRIIGQNNVWVLVEGLDIIHPWLNKISLNARNKIHSFK